MILMNKSDIDSGDDEGPSENKEFRLPIKFISIGPAWLEITFREINQKYMILY